MNRRFGFVALLALGLMVVGADLAMAQPGGRGGDRGGFGRMFNNPLMLLRNERVQEELELVDDQVEELNELQQEIMEKVRDMFRDMRDLDQDERADRMKEIGEYMEDIQKDVDSILLPHQQQRLRQLFYQTQTRRPGALPVTDELAKELNITEEQMEKMREAAEKANEDMRKEMEKLRQKAMEKVLSVLSAEQRAKYKELMGEPFDMGDPRQGFGRGGNRGGDRGGDRGGRGRSDF